MKEENLRKKLEERLREREKRQADDNKRSDVSKENDMFSENYNVSISARVLLVLILLEIIGFFFDFLHNV